MEKQGVTKDDLAVGNQPQKQAQDKGGCCGNRQKCCGDDTMSKMAQAASKPEQDHHFEK